LVRTSKVFISYARENIEEAKRIRADLVSAGVNVWFDQESLLPGQYWKITIKQAIRNSRYFLAVLSTYSVTKRGYVQKELAEALELLDEFPESEIFIIPVRLDKSEPTNERLRALHWIDMFPNWDIGLRKILSVVNFEGTPNVEKENAQYPRDTLDTDQMKFPPKIGQTGDLPQGIEHVQKKHSKIPKESTKWAIFESEQIPEHARCGICAADLRSSLNELGGVIQCNGCGTFMHIDCFKTVSGGRCIFCKMRLY
jgi:hypothetical protein